MSTIAENNTAFTDRRSKSDGGAEGNGAGVERRQFGNSHRGLSPAAHELAVAIDSYKLENRRRYITFEEMYQVIESLGYHK